MILLSLRKEYIVMFIVMQKNPVIRYLCLIWAKYFLKTKNVFERQAQIKVWEEM